MKKQIALALVLGLPARAFAAPLKFAGAPVEVAVAQVTERTVRVEISPLDDQGKPHAMPPSAVLAPLQTREVLRLRELDGARSVAVGTLRVSLNANPLTITLTDANVRTVQELVARDSDGSFSFHTAGPTFGLGEGRQQFDRRGFYYNFQNGQNVLLATHGATMPVPFLFGMDGWGMFIHNPPLQTNNAQNNNIAWGQFDLRGADAGPPPVARGGGGRGLTIPPTALPTSGRFILRPDTLAQTPTQIYLMALDTPADALAEYNHLFGHAVMPPKWTLGYMQSHRSLQGPDEVMAVAQRLRDDKLPCDALIYLGTGYTIATQANQPLGGWNLFNGSLDFNPATFDKPQEMIDRLHAENFKVILHKTNAPANLFGTVNDTGSTARNNIANYWATHEPLMKMGVDAWWPDDGDELPIENRLARVRAYFDGPLKDRPDERPWSLSRNGYAGVAKYGAWLWSGDVQSTWETLQAQVPNGLQTSLAVSPFWGTDIGGFNGAAEYSGELYTRWFEFAAFCPLFRSHGRNWHLHTPWGWDAGDPGPQESARPAAGTNYHDTTVEPACKKALELRYELLPYNYTITREACDTGLPMMRALLLAYPHDWTAVRLGDEYLWGPNLLVAPVIQKGATQRHLYLPAGTWYDYDTGERIESARTEGEAAVMFGRWIDKPVTLATIPLYVKAGTILPLDPVRQYTAEKAGPTTLVVYPGADGTFTLYDDDGRSQAYASDSDPMTQWIKCTWNDARKTLSLDVDPRMKAWPAAMTRTFQVRTVGGTPKTLEFSGTHVEVQL